MCGNIGFSTEVLKSGCVVPNTEITSSETIKTVEICSPQRKLHGFHFGFKFYIRNHLPSSLVIEILNKPQQIRFMANKWVKNPWVLKNFERLGKFGFFSEKRAFQQERPHGIRLWDQMLSITSLLQMRICRSFFSQIRKWKMWDRSGGEKRIIFPEGTTSEGLCTQNGPQVRRIWRIWTFHISTKNSMQEVLYLNFFVKTQNFLLLLVA